MKLNGKDPDLPPPGQRSSSVCVCGCPEGVHRDGRCQRVLPRAVNRPGEGPAQGYDVCECTRFVSQSSFMPLNPTWWTASSSTRGW